MANARINSLPESPYRVQVLDRALGILEILSSDGPNLPLVKLSHRAGLHKSTVHRLLMVLERHRLVEKNPRDGEYRLGLKLFELGSRVLANLDLCERARPYLERLVAETSETAHICILDQGEMVSVANVESPRTVRTPATVGRRTPVYCTAVGKAALASLPPGRWEELLKGRKLKGFTANTITTPSDLRIELELARRRGYAVDDEEIEKGLRCVGAPVWDHTGKFAASISVASPAFRLNKEKIPDLARRVIRAAAQLSADLGYRRQ